jgi:hypothetical protein
MFRLVSQCFGVAATLGLVPLATAAVVTDDFNRPDTSANADASVSVGANYQLTQRAGTRDAQAYIDSNQVGLSQIGGATDTNAADVVLRRTDITLTQNTSPGESFTVSGEVQTFSSSAAGLLYGLAFNFIDADNFYAARINTANDNLQFIQVVNGNVSQFATADLDATPTASTSYTLSITSSSPGSFDYTVVGTGINSAGTVNDASVDFQGGTAGFYQNNTNVTPRFDNLTITTIPEPASLVLVLSGLALSLTGRQRQVSQNDA